MTTPNDLAAQLSNIRLRPDEPKITPTHVLRYKFPAVELLPEGADPLFEEPIAARHRQYPIEVGCQVQTLGTEFFTCFDVETEGQSDIVDVAYGGYKALVQAIERLKCRVGESELRMVRYDRTEWMQSRDSPTYRFRLRTIDRTGGHQNEDFQLDQEQFSCLYDFVEEELWIEILFDLVLLESERAVFEFYKTVTESCGAHVTKSLQDRWRFAWARTRPRTVEEIFLSKFLIEDFKEHLAWTDDGDSRASARLPCGDYVDVRKIWVESVQGEDCYRQKCPTCGSRIMGRSRAEELELEQGKHWLEIEHNREEAKSWQELEALPPLDNVQIFNSAIIADALNVALESFRMAEPVCHPAMCPVNWDETRVIEAFFKEAYGNAFSDGAMRVPFACSAEHLLGDLTVAAIEAVNKEGFTNLTPGLVELIDAWMLRAANLLTHRLCKRKGDEHIGVHQHEYEWRFGRTNIGLHYDQETVDEHNEYEDLIDDLEGKMKETNMGPTMNESGTDESQDMAPGIDLDVVD